MTEYRAHTHPHPLLNVIISIAEPYHWLKILSVGIRVALHPPSDRVVNALKWDNQQKFIINYCFILLLIYLFIYFII